MKSRLAATIVLFLVLVLSLVFLANNVISFLVGILIFVFACYFVWRVEEDTQDDKLFADDIAGDDQDEVALDGNDILDNA